MGLEFGDLLVEVSVVVKGLLEFVDLLLLFFDYVEKANGELAKFETIKYHKIVPQDFTIDSGELTPTLKLKRKVITQRYKDLLDSMYTG